MTVTYLKKAEKTPQTGTDETRKIVSDMLAKIEAGGEAEALRYGVELDGYHGEAIVSADSIMAAGKQVSETLKEDIQFAYRLAESTTGRVFFTAGKDLDRYVVWDYVNRKRSIIG